MADPRPSLADIRRQYQVADDELVDYRPRIAGAVDIPGTSARSVTRTEAAMLDRLTFDRGLVGLSGFASLAERAQAAAGARYPDQPVPPHVPADRANEWQSNDGPRDAFRHAYWNALMTQQYGRGWTAAFATAHEARPGNPANREAMDLYNNAVGRSIGAAHPNATPEQLADLVQRAVGDGRMVVLDRSGALAWSDQVRPGQHGLTPPDVIGPALPVPAPGRTLSRVDRPTDAELAAVTQHPLFDPAAAALDRAGLDPLGAPAVVRAAVQARLAGIDRIDMGHPVPGPDGHPTRHLFAMAPPQSGAAGPEYALITREDLARTGIADAAAALAQQSRDADALARAQPAPQRPLSLGA
ncbi:DUF6973 domain-containing protein [Lysobacter humi (ex Lee et al. 2017)]